ncbi:MAG TPA: 16S rRNA (guanine(966)-N(2))-methyltransferase RsmD, partial [Desulfobacteraceae bacterium]|nr:16S rRNA (guanine(966)-N(2))-methyltransferase RsmD [Desulfobacteraceae bacterium]
AKGRLLASFKGLDIRPTPDRVREAVFNIIGQDLSGFYVLDLFAGTGSLGIEALSRGAGQSVFIDMSQQAIRIVKKNLALCMFKDSGTVFRFDLRRGIPTVKYLGRDLFDLIFLDPPYGRDLLDVLLEDVSSKGVLSSGSWVVAESSKNEVLPVSFGTISMLDTRTYGDTRITIYKNRD